MPNQYNDSSSPFLKSGKEEANKDSSTWHKKPLGVFLLYVFIALLGFLGIRVPSPGEAVAVLAVAAAVMTVLGEMKGPEKVAWILLLFGFLSVELTSINVERKAQDDIQKAARAEQLQHFGKIAQGIEGSIKASDQHFKATMDRSNRIFGGVKDNLAQITGIGDYCYFLSTNEYANGVQLMVVNSGELPVSMCRVVIHEVSNGQETLAEQRRKFDYPVLVRDFGPLPAGRNRGFMTDVILPANSYLIQIWTRNEFYVEDLEITKSTKALGKFDVHYKIHAANGEILNSDGILSQVK